jgi:hypothetical protein
MLFMWEVLKLWPVAALIFGFAWALGSAVWRLHTGRRMPFGRIFSHWDFKDGFMLAFFSPIIGLFYLWRWAIRRRKGST